MTMQRTKAKFSRLTRIFQILLLTTSLLRNSVAQKTGENNNEVVNIEPSQTDIGTDSHTITDSSLDSQTFVNDQTPIPSLSVEGFTQTVEQTIKVLTEAADIQPSVSDTPGRTTSEHDNLLQPSSVEPSASVQETSSDAAMETMGTTQSIYTDQSEEVVAQQTSGTDTNKSLSMTAPEQVTEMPQESQDQATETSEKPDAKVDKDQLTDAEPKPVAQQELEAPELIPVGKVEEEAALPPDGKPGPVDISVGEKPVEKTEEGAKPDEEGLTFNEWTQKVLAEEEKEKHHAKDDSVAVSTTKQRKKKNYALHECGAKILASNPEATNVKGVLNPNRDDYMINPCKVKQWFVAELCEPIQAVNVEMASLELFSSQPKSFKVFLSDRYPTKDWKLAVHKEMSEERVVQSFDVDDAEGYFAKFVRVELLDHYGSEHYCPLTLFRLFGVGVVDYDINDGDDADHDDPGSDNEEVQSEEDGGDSKNLFSSAKDTVLKIVKKVLNVDDITDEVQKLNETLESLQQNDSIETEQTLNASASNEMSLPCPPDVRIPGSGQSEPGTNVGDGQQHPVLPEIRDDVALVTKIEDHEQIETGDQSFLRKMKQKLIHERIENCMSCTNHTKKVSFNRSFPVMQLCVYVKLLLDKYRGQTCSLPILTVKTEKEQKEDKNKMQTSQACSQVLPPESESKVAEMVTQSDNHKFEASDINGDPKHKSVIESSTLAKPTDQTAHLKDKVTPTVTANTESKELTEVIPEHEEVILEHTKVVQESLVSDFQSGETIIPTQTVLVQQSNGQGQDSIITDTSVVVEARPESTVISVAPDKIDPSPSFVIDSEQSILTSLQTPVLSQAEFRSEGSSASVTIEAGVKKDQALPETVSVVDKTSTTIDTLPVEPSASIAVEPPHPVKQEPVQDKQEQEPLNGKSQHTTEDGVLAVEQVVNIIDETSERKTAEEESKKKNLDLVKVPLVPFTKRETAIMRLNNRIKILEQNVSLSSRFLEELSKRYKKQSEDMMKLLNKTVARLNNATLEAEIKDKLHDDAIAAMESKVENLTAIVTELTVKLDTLNKQVTDRQMIWTSIEIIVILIILIIVFRRSKTPALTPEIKEITQTHSAPTQSVKPAYRRNSISGPATPLKAKSDLDPGPSLQRYSSETTLVHSEYPVIEPGESPFFTPKPKDGQKKKKKKKHKNLESKYHVGLKGSNSDVTLPNGGTTSTQQLPGSSINSAGVLFRGENNEKLDTSLQRSNAVTSEKRLVDSVRAQRSNSSVSGSSSGTSIGSSEANVCDKTLGLHQGVFNKVLGHKFNGLSLDSGTNVSGSKKSKASPPLPRNEKSFVKTHKRQKSLPNTSTRVPVVENLGRIENDALDNLVSDNLAKEKRHSLQKGTSKGKGAGVRKSLSMTASSKGSKSMANVIDAKFNSSFKMERHSTQLRGGNKNTGENDFSAINGFASCNVMNNSDSIYDHENNQRITQLGGGGVKGSKSCCSIDPGGSVSFGQYNGHALNENGFLNGHSFSNLDTYDNVGKMKGYSVNDNFHLDENPDFQKKDNTGISSQSGWRKMIWWS